MKNKYFSYSEHRGFNIHKTIDEAKNFAENELSECLDDEDFDDAVDVCCGQIIYSVHVEKEKSDDPEYLDSTNYILRNNTIKNKETIWRKYPDEIPENINNAWLDKILVLKVDKETKEKTVHFDFFANCEDYFSEKANDWFCMDWLKCSHDDDEYEITHWCYLEDLINLTT